ncbi:trehalose-phosphatase [Alteripontixanthobacter muriae]|uniref:trehalose-phosphatase n=1 Tax=Alteripontixanthobacter muriae TaxID=2705546 RepID=UPI002FC3DBAD
MDSDTVPPAFAGFRAIVLDLDGAVTDTAKLHAASWKRLFDEFLQHWNERTGSGHAAFDIGSDYREHVDGKPRYAGVQAFLTARDIELPYGGSKDPPDRETVCGLGNRKNEIFNEVLAKDGVEVFESSVKLIRRLRQAGFRTALVTSSKNAMAVLDAAGIADLFEIVVDGVKAERLKLNGKPDPDTFAQAAEELGLDPRDAVAVEDALSGVEAASRAKYGLVIGVDRNHHAAALREHGADIVVQDLGELDMAAVPQGSGPPDASTQFVEIARRLERRTPAVFLDYDGTLTPIVDRPELAVLDDDTRSVIRRLSGLCTVAIISGRDRADVARLVGLDELIYAGSHGFDIVGPGGLEKQHDRAKDFLGPLERAETRLRDALASVEGAAVERKRFAIAVHYRLVDPAEAADVEAVVERTVADATVADGAVEDGAPMLRKTGGKKIFEIRPNVAWDKGRAVIWLLDALGLDRSDILPIYIGDDETDEDAFRALRARGLGIMVADVPQGSAAKYVLGAPSDVAEFLGKLIQLLEART